ncbi:MAG: endonuclease [Kangiella sp.]|nr:MAG: endonuclease [Kangiella sp.]
MNEELKHWFLYIILCSDDCLYTGITTDIDRRWKEHSGDLKKGAKFFRGRKPKEILYVEFFENRSEASQREYSIKKLSRSNKLLVISSKDNQIGEFEYLNSI